jgi:Mg-chelatase subunit ChlD
MSQGIHDTAGRADALTPPEAAQVRTSQERAEALKQYIEGLLPSHLAADVDVVITEQVSTAAVLPATEDALLDGDETDFDRQQAKQLVERVDGDYLVLVTGREADTDAICLSDQLTADTAHQFGLAFHETLHVLKTSFGAVQTLVEDEVDEQYQEFTHELINIGEDGAIENEAQTGDDFTERAGNRLTLVREMHSQTVEDLPDGEREFSFGDALLKALHDEIIYPTGVTDALLDESDSRVTFSTDDEREAFLEVHSEIEALRDDILSMRSDHSDRLYEDDREASLERAKRIVVFWQDVLKPIVEDGEPPEQQDQSSQQQQGQPSQQQQGQGQPQDTREDGKQDQNKQQQGGGSEPDQQPSSDEPSGSDESEQSDTGESGREDADFDCPDCNDSFDSEHGRRVHYGQQHGDTDDLDEQLDDSGQVETGDGAESEAGADAGEDSPQGEFDPDELSLDADSYDDPLQNVGDHPSVADEPDPSDVDLDPKPASEESESPADDSQDLDDSNDGNVGGEPDSTDGEESDEQNSSSGLGEEGDESGGSEATSSSGDAAGDSGSEPDGDGGQSGPETTTTSSSASSSELASHATQSEAGTENEQATFGDFAGDTGSSEGGDDTTEGEAAEEIDGDGSQGGDGAEGDDSRQPGEDTDSSSGADTPRSDGADSDGETGGDDGVDFDPSETTDSQDTPVPSGASEDGREAGEQSSTLSDTDSPSTGSPEAGDGEAGSGESEVASGTQPDAGPERAEDDGAGGGEASSGPAHAESDLEPEDFSSDRQRANRTADNSTIDEGGLEDDLRSLESALGEEEETAPDGDAGGGSGAGPGSVDELTILPDPEDGEMSEDWQAIEKSADAVADTLAKELRLDQQTDTRNGLSAGTRVNAKTAYRLNHNDPRTFSETLPGDEKEYFVVLVLDRSSSMGPGYYGRSTSGPTKIDIATSAVARFAVACEDLGIDVAIIDFYDEEARYVKPPSVEAEFAQESILNTDNAGGTPLADALSLARSVAEADSKESLIISITDDKPAEVEDVEDQIRSSYAPVCSLTIATDCEVGNPPDKAEQLERTYNQTTTVYEPSKLDDGIDRLASLLGAY